MDLRWAGATERNQACPECRKPNKMTRRDLYEGKHCDECTERCRAMMETPAAHLVIELLA